MESESQLKTGNFGLLLGSGEWGSFDLMRVGLLFDQLSQSSKFPWLLVWAVEQKEVNAHLVCGGKVGRLVTGTF